MIRSRLLRAVVLGFFTLSLIAITTIAALFPTPVDAGEEEYVVHLPAIGNPSAQVGATPTAIPSATATPTATPSPVPTATATTPPITYDETVLIPAGSFTMGCDATLDPWDCGLWGWPDTPLHTVNLGAYRIDKYEVTNARYAACVKSGDCTAPRSTQAYDLFQEEYYEYYGVPTYANFPVVNVTWLQADAFCRASGGRLPTEAEWERAARGHSDRRVWPWGNTLACSNANVFSDEQGISCATGLLTAVGAYPTGANPNGVVDMAGNAAEWVNDWSYREYTEESVTNPQGPESGTSRLLRGGSFNSSGRGARVTYRDLNTPDSWEYDYGFRCVHAP